MNKILNASLAFLIPFFAVGQGYFTINGHVVDGETGNALAYATISLEGKPLGTVSNTEGDFKFHIPHRLLGDTLVISFIGYKNYRQSVRDLLTDKSPVMPLQQQVLILDEVVINSAQLSAKEIVQKAVREIKNNYPDQPFQLECFFREIEEENGKYVLLSEAAIQLYDKSFITKRKSLQEKIKPIEIRRSYSYGQIRGGDNNIGCAFTDLIENNDVRYQRGMLNTKRNQYKLDSISYFNDRPVFVISMRNKLDSGQMFIDTETYAFVKIGLERRKRGEYDDPYYFKWDYQDSLKLGRTKFSFTVEFKEFEGKMYVLHMAEDEQAHVYDPVSKEIMIEKNERLELIVNEIKNDAVSKEEEMKKLNYRCSFDIGAYNEAFWKNYNILTLTPLDKKLITDLEKETSLQEQFKSSPNRQ